MIRQLKKWAQGTRGCELVAAANATETAYRAVENRLLELQMRVYAFFEDHNRQYNEHQHILAATMLGVGTNLTAAEQPRRALNFQRIGLAVSPKIVEGYLHLLETCVHLRQTNIALEAFGGALSLPIAEAPAASSAAPDISLDGLLEYRRPPESRLPMTIFTSLMPRRLDVQKAAIDSWLRAGFVIRSVNVKKEIDELADIFPNVDFIEFTSQDGFLVPIAHLCGLMAKDENRIVGIVNSDIIFLDAANLIRNLQAEYRHSLVFGHRYDLQSPADTIGRPYHEGFDYFHGTRKLAQTGRDKSAHGCPVLGLLGSVGRAAAWAGAKKSAGRANRPHDASPHL